MSRRIDPDVGFTSAEISDPQRFVERRDLIEACIRGLNNPTGLIAIYGKRGVGKSSLLRQLQKLAQGNYSIALRAGLDDSIPSRPRRYATVFYECDSYVTNGYDLVGRLIADQSEEEGLLRLVPGKGRQLVEVTESKEASAGFNLKLIFNAGVKGADISKYVKVVPDDQIQTFRNFITAIVEREITPRRLDGLLILVDEFDVIQSKAHIGSLFRSLSSDKVKFAICGIGNDLNQLIEDHASLDRLLEQGLIHVGPMQPRDARAVIDRAEILYNGQVSFSHTVKSRIVTLSQGYPYLIQLLGKACIEALNRTGKTKVTEPMLAKIITDTIQGRGFPTLERSYSDAIGDARDRQVLLHLMAEQGGPDAVSQTISLAMVRDAAIAMGITNIPQLVARLLQPVSGPALAKVGDAEGVYEFVNPVFRIYVRLRAY